MKHKKGIVPRVQNSNPVTLRSHDMSVVLHWSLEDRRDSEHNNARDLDDNKDDNNATPGCLFSRKYHGVEVHSEEKVLAHLLILAIKW